MTSKDQNGTVLALGDAVKIIAIPATLTSGLPTEDQEAIRQQVGAELEIAGFDAYGNVELEFEDSAGHLHTIWLDAMCVKKITGSKKRT